MLLEMPMHPEQARIVLAALVAVGLPAEMRDDDPDFSTISVNVEERRDPSRLEAVQLVAAFVALAEAT